MKKSQRPQRRKQIEKPNVFQYSDYREFLKDWFRYLKKTRRFSSIEILAKNAGFSTSYLYMIVNGDRDLTEKSFEKLKKHLHLTSTETSYLDALRVLSDSQTHGERIEALKRLQNFESFRAENSRESESYRFLSHWYFAAIHEMAKIKSFRYDADWIYTHLRPKVPKARIREAMSFLMDNGFLERTRSGRVRARSKDVKCRPGIQRIAMNHFHREMTQLASESIDRFSKQDRNLRAKIVSIPSERIEDLHEILEETIDRVVEQWAGKHGSDHVRNISFYSFPLSNRVSKPEKHS